MARQGAALALSRRESRMPVIIASQRRNRLGLANLWQELALAHLQQHGMKILWLAARR